MTILAMLAALTVSSASADPAPQATLSRAEVQAMAPETVASRLFGDLSTILLPLSPADQVHSRPNQPLRALMFRTVGTGTYFPGVCRSDLVGVEFENAGPDRGAETRVRPRSIRTSSQFYVPDPTALSSASFQSRVAQEAAQAACRRVDPRHAHLIHAPSDWDASEGLRALDVTAAEARSGTLPAPDCGEPGLGQPACVVWLARVGLDQVVIVNRCRDAMSRPCHEIQVSSQPLSDWRAGATVRIETDYAGHVTGVAVRRTQVIPVASPPDE